MVVATFEVAVNGRYEVNLVGYAVASVLLASYRCLYCVVDAVLAS